MEIMGQGVSRRDFILAGSVGAGALLSGMGAVKLGLASSGASSLVVARKHGTVKEMVEQCVESLGGIEKFVPDGSKVAIKVNGSRNSIPDGTDPEVIKQVVRLVKTANPAEITVYDHVLLLQKPWIHFQRIASVVEAEGARAVELHENRDDYVMEEVPGVSLKSVYVARILHEADALISVPLLKSFASGLVSIGLKNHMGSLLYRRDEPDVPDAKATPHGCPGGINQGVADLNCCPSIREKHRLTVVDAIHPKPAAIGSVDYGGIIAGGDPVATDYIGNQVLRRYDKSMAENYPYITNAAALGLGTNNPFEIVFDERDTSAHVPEFELPLAVAGMAGLALAYRSRRARNEGEGG